MQRGQHAKSFAYGLRSVKAAWPTLPGWHQAARHDLEQFARETIQLRARNRRNLITIRTNLERGSLRPQVRPTRFRVPPETDDLPSSRKDLDRVQFARPDVGTVAIDADLLRGEPDPRQRRFAEDCVGKTVRVVSVRRLRRCRDRSLRVQVESPDNNSSHRMADTRR